MFLIQECNEQDWENPFECSNKLILQSIYISESALTDARNRLKQLGMIDFKAGKRNESAPVYTLFYPFKKGKETGKPEGKETGNEEGKDPNLYNKPNSKPDLNETSASNEAGADEKNNSDSGKDRKPQKEKGSAQKEKEVTPHWNRLKDGWIAFYKSKKDDIEPTFKAREAKALQEIAGRLQRLTANAPNTAMHQWTEEYAVLVFQHFLKKAWAVKWRRDNFMLHILSSHFDAIVQTNEQGNNDQESDELNADHKRDLEQRIAKLTGQG